MSASLPEGELIRILTQTPEGQNVLKAFFDSWDQSRETDIIKKFKIACNKAYLEAQEPRNNGIDIKLIIFTIDGFIKFIQNNHELVSSCINDLIKLFKNSKRNNKYR